ncbi:MAG: nicotinate (nicotinamide) nucleotide adenylyltransferase [Planctomycetota bacterium]|jgi:nicotinate-nucleotide adenylyltransferase|nr:nicotinate (nicotinamide) nucleotide adenylyltransferase [Planctomycetota bacterium]
MRIGILGGSFNPPHRGHLALARAVLNQGLAEGVLLVPAAVPPHKEAPRQADAPTRLRMTELLAAEDSRLSVDGLELARSGPSFSIDTVRELAAAHPDNCYRLIIGSDLAVMFAAWRDFRELLRLAPPLVAERPGVPLSGPAERLYPGLAPDEAARLAAGRFPMPPVDVSSTQVRQLLAEGADEAKLLSRLTRPVYDFIRARGLYGTLSE